MIISALLAPIISVFEKVAGCFGMFGGGGGDMAAAAALGGVAAAGVDAGAILEDVEATREVRPSDPSASPSQLLT